MKLNIKYYLNLLFRSSLARSSGIYTISGVINAAIPIVLLPILTTRLTPDDYGIVAMFNTLVSIVTIFVSMNLSSAIMRKFYEVDEKEMAPYIGTSFILVTIALILSSIVMFIFADQIASYSGIPLVWLKYVLVISYAQFFIAVILAVYRFHDKPQYYGLIQILRSLINVLLTLYMVLYLNKTYDGRLEAYIIATVLFGGVALVLLVANNRIHFNVKKADIKHALSYGMPLIPHAIGGMLFTTIDRYFLTNYFGLEQTGNYSVAYQIGAAVSILTMSFNIAYGPWLFHRLNENVFAMKVKIVKFTYAYFIILAIGSMLVVKLFPLFVSIFVGPGFTQINVFSSFIVYGFIFQGMYFMVTNYIHYSKKTYLQAILTLSVGLLKIPITYFAIKLWGAAGVSISWCISFFLLFASTWILSARVYKMPWGIIFQRTK
jgi:O-antigen/teichoic acid export membrane protein